MNTIIEAIGTANPSLRRSQDHAADFMSRIEALSPTARSRLRAIYERSAIEYRYSCIADYSGFDPESFEFFPPSWSLEPAPTTGDRNRKYRAEAAPLLVQAAEEALGSAGLEPVTVTHVVVVTCTGFYSPGLDVALVKGLGLRPDVRRTVVGFMGCHAAFNGLRLARSFCRSDPNACVLVACVELCTLHFNVDDSVEATVINALFSDGAAVAVLRNGPSKASTAMVPKSSSSKVRRIFTGMFIPLRSPYSSTMTFCVTGAWVMGETPGCWTMTTWWVAASRKKIW